MGQCIFTALKFVRLLSVSFLHLIPTGRRRSATLQFPPGPTANIAHNLSKFQKGISNAKKWGACGEGLPVVIAASKGCTQHVPGNF